MTEIFRSSSEVSKESVLNIHRFDDEYACGELHPWAFARKKLEPWG